MVLVVWGLGFGGAWGVEGVCFGAGFIGLRLRFLQVLGVSRVVMTMTESRPLFFFERGGEGVYVRFQAPPSNQKGHPFYSWLLLGLDRGVWGSGSGTMEASACFQVYRNPGVRLYSELGD